MLTFPNAKINLGLNITRKRPDGYHDLETVFYPIPLTDALEAVPASAGSPSGTCHLHLYGHALEGDAGDNLVVRAYRLLAARFPLPPLDIHLYKRIPLGAGLGGGSADAAFMLKMLNEVGQLGLSEPELEEYAARLGADCAFFVANRPTFAQGIGNLFTPLTLSLRGYRLLLVKPPVFVSTRDAFSHIRPRQADQSPIETVSLPVTEWRHRLVNDFEASVFPLHPRIARIKDDLYRMGALYASMSGSGSSVYGLFAPDTDELPPHDWGPDAFVFQSRLP